MQEREIKQNNVGKYENKSIIVLISDKSTKVEKKKAKKSVEK